MNVNIKEGDLVRINTNIINMRNIGLGDEIKEILTGDSIFEVSVRACGDSAYFRLRLYGSKQLLTWNKLDRRNENYPIIFSSDEVLPISSMEQIVIELDR